jgi:hypothetical protein
VLHVYGQSMIIWYMTNLPVGVSTVDQIVQYVWMALMYLGYNTARNSLSLIIIKDFFHRIIHLGMTHNHF